MKPALKLGTTLAKSLKPFFHPFENFIKITGFNDFPSVVPGFKAGFKDFQAVSKIFKDIQGFSKLSNKSERDPCKSCQTTLISGVAWKP